MQALHVPPTEKDAVSRSLRKPVTFPKSLSSAAAAGLLAVCSLAAALTSDAGLVYWGSEGFVENADSKSRVWTADFTMTLGVFKSGFTPTEANREQWTANWHQLSLAKFSPDEARFAGVVDVSQLLPSGTDSQVYFWAKNGSDLTKGPEWLLVTKPDWKWPAASATSAPAITWTTGKSASAIVGEIGTNGHHLTSERLAPVPVSRDQWLARYFPNSLASRAPDADPDGDGIPNRLEYFLGSDPNNSSSRVSPDIRRATGATTLTLQKNPYAPSKVAVETSSNLKSWSASDPQVVQDRPDLIEVKFTGQPAGKSAFFRFKVEEVKP
ncbi:MAG: hypothetical protein EOP88_20050 [Verrucomicrobiaceae bacterium]|nr:MAG: hypothetical protein EOP88_20050 [Verrucomicrobiaceae bacterium]